MRNYVEAAMGLSRYIKPFIDSVLGEPIYALAGTNSRTIYITRSDMDDLGGNVYFAKSGGKKHESGRLKVRNLNGGGQTVEVDPRTDKPEGESPVGWLRRVFGLSENEARKTLKQKR